MFEVDTVGSEVNLLHIFGGGSDGGFPFGGVILSGNTFLRNTQSPATVFRINTDGTGFLTLHCLSCDHETNSRNIQILGGLVLAGESLYGMTLEGGLYNVGFIFRLDTNGAGFTNLHNFNVSEGSRPFLVALSYRVAGFTGQATQGGTNGAGIVFAMNTDELGFHGPA